MYVLISCGSIDAVGKMLNVNIKNGRRSDPNSFQCAINLLFSDHRPYAQIPKSVLISKIYDYTYPITNVSTNTNPNLLCF